jgi:hypothetical protein
MDKEKVEGKPEGKPEEEEVVEKAVDAEDAEEGEGDTQDYTEEELQALDAGWKPKEQWEGDEKKWVPADEFNRRGELFGKIDSVTKDLRETKKALRMLQDHHAKVRETEYNRAVAGLRAQKKQALENNDVDAVEKIDDAIMDMKATEKVAKQTAATKAAEPDPRFVAWVNDNSWYAQDDEMRNFADDVGIAHAKSHPEKSPTDVLKYVEQRIRKTYPEKFKNQNRNKPNAVEGRNAQFTRSKREDSFELSDEERRVMNTFVSDGIMTKEDYIRDLKSIKGL